ncbi:hypothetical protein ACHMW4_20610 [Mesorhizobium sp. UC22_110]|uniref:hypothetical protein n=1 Tax=unclassified Mesorhizobium TaxID=325217 RepID=UPI00366A5A87
MHQFVKHLPSEEGFTTSRINRRTLLLQSGGVVIATTVEAIARDAPHQEPSAELAALIKAHGAAYAALRRTVDEIGSRGSLFDNACRIEEKALVAVCAYPAISEGDRLAKAAYLLEIEARGELDLPQHTQALLRSTLWTG